MPTGTANANSAADAIKETDPTVDTVRPPKIGDAVESVSIQKSHSFILLGSCKNNLINKKSHTRFPPMLQDWVIILRLLCMCDREQKLPDPQWNHRLQQMLVRH